MLLPEEPKVTEHEIQMSMTEMFLKIKGIMEKRNALYGRFLAPWNIDKANQLASTDADLNTYFKKLQFMFNAARGEADNFSERLDTALIKQLEFKSKCDRLEADLARARKEYETLHSNYDQLVYQLESNAVLQSEISSLQTEIMLYKTKLEEAERMAINAKSGKKNKKHNP